MTEFLLLRFVHVVAGSVWVGTTIFFAVVLAPALGGLGPAAGPAMAALRARGLFVFLPFVAILTILSGIRLMWIGSSGFSAAYFETAAGAAYGGAGALAILAFVLGLSVSRPNAARQGALAVRLSQATDDATRAALHVELAVVRRWGTWISVFVTGMLVVGAAGMAVARYLPG
jgi:hypothetical protein